MSFPSSLVWRPTPADADADAHAQADPQGRARPPTFTLRGVALTLGCLVAFSALGGAIVVHGYDDPPSGLPSQTLLPSPAVLPSQTLLPSPAVLPVTLAGPTDVATASEVSCSPSGADIVVTGTLVATAPEARGMTVYATLHPAAGGVSIGTSAVVPIPASSVGQARTFRGVISDTGTLTGDRCVVLWVANPAQS
jgi:hypothetical protein